jgi:hypothetical protein
MASGVAVAGTGVGVVVGFEPQATIVKLTIMTNSERKNIALSKVKMGKKLDHFYNITEQYYREIVAIIIFRKACVSFGQKRGRNNAI